jgi:teichuronic acid biosynthesis glycosyltransferase TuaC
MQSTENKPQLKVVVLTSLFPSEEYPGAGTFIKERMFRLAKFVPIIVVAPQFWSPVDWLIRKKWPNFRKLSRTYEVVDDIEIYRPKVLSIPMVFKSLDGIFFALCCFPTLKKIKKRFAPTLLDAHFAYPDGYAASLLAQWLDLKLSITLRGSKDTRLLGTPIEKQVKRALLSADLVISVSNQLNASVAQICGVSEEKTMVIGNGVDLTKFHRTSGDEIRQQLKIPKNSKVLIAVGNLIPLKGFDRLINLMPVLRQQAGDVHLIIVGGAPAGDPTVQSLTKLISTLGLTTNVHMIGKVLQSELHRYYSAANVFVSATEFEGWSNVLLEAMACGLPIVTTRVGGNPQVVATPEVGTLVEYWNAQEAIEAIADALERSWDYSAIRAYAESNSWDSRILTLQASLQKL